MKSLFITMGLLIGLNAHAGYKANELTRWIPEGLSVGTDFNGNSCKVILSSSSLDGHTSVEIHSKGVELHKAPRFNQFISNILESIKESNSGIEIVLKSRPGNSYTTAVKQTINVTKSSSGTEVRIEEKEVRFLGKTKKANCIID